jgi:hypothetical protein
MAQKTKPPTVLLWRVFVAEVTFFTEPLPGNDSEDTHTDTQTDGGGIYRACNWDGLRCHDIHAKFDRDWFRHLKVDGRGEQTAW